MRASSLAKSCGAVVLYVVAAALVLFSFAMTVEADNPAAFPGRRDNDGAFGALLCVGIAVLSAAVAVTSLSRRLLSKVVCAAIILVCVDRVVGIAGQL
ncbi:hypothetical protein OEB94_08915 [Streptomyces sp. ICN988]|uniref:hypothetical protein n=1 Tax=unclassified Streptomyces TaxID=2593676 RepID=UPI0021E50D2A|nr:hypothetical protein [Streptomyces sp. ICN988]MCV2459382.1 hypothetical protein [Streptomyces sp. ICN988]